MVWSSNIVRCYVATWKPTFWPFCFANLSFVSVSIFVSKFTYWDANNDLSFPQFRLNFPEKTQSLTTYICYSLPSTTAAARERKKNYFLSFSANHHLLGRGNTVILQASPSPKGLHSSHASDATRAAIICREMWRLWLIYCPSLTGGNSEHKAGQVPSFALCKTSATLASVRTAPSRRTAPFQQKE